jgi:hypothetical protein
MNDPSVGDPSAVNTNSDNNDAISDIVDPLSDLVEGTRYRIIYYDITKPIRIATFKNIEPVAVFHHLDGRPENEDELYVRSYEGYFTPVNGHGGRMRMKKTKRTRRTRRAQRTRRTRRTRRTQRR